LASSLQVYGMVFPELEPTILSDWFNFNFFDNHLFL
jgi:hypothetical protein